MKKNWPVVLIMLLFLVPWAVNAGKFFYNLDAKYSDLTVSHLPNAIYLVDALKTDRQIPLWSNLIMSGAPFAADPLSGIWYPPGWLAYFLPQPAGFNLTALLHILWSGLGMFLFLWGLGLRREAALTGGLAFLLMPKLFSHLSAGHVTLVYAVAWTPWLFLAELRRAQARSGDLFRSILPGLVLGLIFLADPRWSVYAAAAWLAFSIWQSFGRAQGRSFRDSLKRWLPGFGIQTVLALSVSAVLLIPLLEFTRLSTRSSMTSMDVLAFSLPPAQLAGLILPNIGGYAEWQVYPGAMVFLLVIFALFLPEVRKKAAFWLVLAGAAAVLSLGSLWPFAEKLAELPGLNLLRVPSRAWFLAAIGLIVTASYALDEILQKPGLKLKQDPMVVLLPLTALAVFLTVGLYLMEETPPSGFIWGAAALALGTAALFLLQRPSTGRGSAVGVVLLLAIDLVGVNWLGVSFRTNCEVMAEGFEAANFVARQDGEFRVYSPSYSIPQHTAAAEGLELIDGVNPLHLAAYSDFMSHASGVGGGGYSVTVPTFSSGDPENDNRNAIPDTEMLGLLNGKFIVSAYELDYPRLEEIWRSGETRVYENLDSLPRAWVQEPDAEPGGGKLGEVRFERQQADLLIAEAEGPGLAVFSIPDYPGWEVSVDGIRVQKLRVADLLIGVPLEGGSHQIILKFRPVSVSWGLAISLLAWILVLILGVISVMNKGRAGEIGEN